MILDMHVHTEASGDAKPTVSDYAQWALELKEQYTIHGFVVTEHRFYSPSRNAVLTELGRETGLVILQGVEMETDYGHLLAYGVTPQFLDKVDVSRRVSGQFAAQTALETGVVIVPAHPCRPALGCGPLLRQLAGIKVIEQLNGSNDRSENKLAESMSKSLALFGTGGSDAHYVADFGFCMTRFEKNISNDRELVSELLRGEYRPIYLEEARHA